MGTSRPAADAWSARGGVAHLGSDRVDFGTALLARTRMAAMRSCWAAVLLVAIVAVGTGGAVAAHARAKHHDERSGVPVLAATPTVVPHPNDKSGVCSASDGLPVQSAETPVGRRLWVGQHPAGGVALWLPGMNSRCRPVLTRLDAQHAEDFANAVEHASALPQGPFSCPADDNSGVTVFLTYPSQPGAEVVQIGLTGCGGMSAPGRDRRNADAALAALGPIPKGLEAVARGRARS